MANATNTTNATIMEEDLALMSVEEPILAEPDSEDDLSEEEDPDDD